MNSHPTFPDTHDIKPKPDLLEELVWPDNDWNIPDWIYTDERIYALEQERIFRGRTWNYVGLEVEVPEPGSFIRSYLGDTPIIVARDEEGEIHAFENRCAHRGAEFCKVHRGKAENFVCPYHQWTYSLSGELISVPFRRGVKGHGGMPKDFDMKENSLRRLAVARRHGVIFVSAHHDMESLEDYLGPMMLDQFDTVFPGRELKLLGVHRNYIEGNWKLYQENLKDPYHATLLHTYFTTFGLFMASNESFIMTDETGRHATTCQRHAAERPKENETTAEIASFKPTMQLAAPEVLQLIPESDSPWNSNALTIWPNMILIRQTNIFSARQIVPMGVNRFMLVWVSFGFADDTPEMEAHRLRQNNIFGPGGFIGIDDNEALKLVRDGIVRSVPRHGLARLGRDDDPDTTVITDRAIRGMYRWYRTEMGL